MTPVAVTFEPLTLNVACNVPDTLYLVSVQVPTHVDVPCRPLNDDEGGGGGVGVVDDVGVVGAVGVELELPVHDVKSRPIARPIRIGDLIKTDPTMEEIL
jgi:hypothetical protein